MSTTQVTAAEASDVPATLDASDIQATVLRPRPRPYRGEYVILRVDDTDQGREMVRRILPHVAPADEWWVPSLPGWLGMAFTFEGLRALRRAPRSSMTSAAMHRPTGSIPSALRTCTSPWRSTPRAIETCSRSWMLRAGHCTSCRPSPSSTG